MGGGGTEPDSVDVLIVGAGISGIGVAYYLQRDHPGRSYAIAEARAASGGTWDLFRYPGVRSDSDLHTFGYEFRPWRSDVAIADGDSILAYLRETAAAYGIDRHIRCQTRVISASWSPQDARWTVTTEHAQSGERSAVSCRWLLSASGYYRYDQGFTPEFAGRERFSGPVVHPQQWPADLDYAGQRVVVIGSGATAVSMIPSLTENASHVTMLQRTPSYMISAMKVEPTANAIRRWLPLRMAHWIVRWRNALIGSLGWVVARRAPEFSKRLARRIAERNLPDGYDIDTHFTPPYKPWDQRLCIMVGADLYKAISLGGLDMVTDHVDSVDATGIVLRSGRRLDADVIITATGIQLQSLGGITLSVDGAQINPHDRFVFRRHLLEDVPNAAWCVGYTNASWTLGADLTARSVAKLLAYMDSHGYTRAYPHLGKVDMAEQPAFNLQSGYVLRSPDELPKSGTRRPWVLSHNFVRDVLGRPFESIEESMVFGRAATASAGSHLSRTTATRTPRMSS
jgi:cation diffusion facilitator CzcD-associated flavoprotein CzcO